MDRPTGYQRALPTLCQEIMRFYAQPFVTIGRQIHGRKRNSLLPTANSTEMIAKTRRPVSQSAPVDQRVTQRLPGFLCGRYVTLAGNIIFLISTFVTLTSIVRT